MDVPSHPVAGTFGPTPVELSRLSFHDSSKLRFGPGKLTQAMDAEEHEGSRPDGLRQQVLPLLDVRLTADTYTSVLPRFEKAEADAPVALRLVPSAFPFGVRRPLRDLHEGPKAGVAGSNPAGGTEKHQVRVWFGLHG
ncbi:hypothetical protein ACFV2U_21595 [Streptomyces sp. NPDC059697]|uniref:hypothetical protein n=1 Tax=Streptomyces sp. NPDC059697 TaxID=3346912 RepID=UPI00367DE6CF